MEESFKKYNQLRELAESWVRDFASGFNDRVVLEQACDYSLSAPGKRIRLVLCLAVAEMLGIKQELLRSYCLALECIHTFSLIHDDLPCMDNDQLRRGKPTCHVKYGEAVALLAGDRLFGQAFLTLAEDGLISDCERANLSKLLSKAVVEMCDGQMMDIEASGRSPLVSARKERSPEELLFSRHLKKTGALIKAAVVAPCLFLPPNQQERVEGSLISYGEQLGLLFQITDDLLDVQSVSSETGKDVGSDQRQGVPSFVSVYGLSGATQVAENTEKMARQALVDFAPQNAFLLWLCDYILSRKS